MCALAHCLFWKLFKYVCIREEQTVATDQDNAIIFEGDGPRYREAFKQLAAAINHGLAEVGFPLSWSSKL